MRLMAAKLTRNMRGTVLATIQKQLLGLFRRFQLPRCIADNYCNSFYDQLVSDQMIGLNFLHKLENKMK